MHTTNLSRLTKWAAPLVLVLSLGMSGMAALPAGGQEIPPEQLALARKYIDLTNNFQIYETTLLKTAFQTLQTLSQQNPNLEKPITDAITKTLADYKGHDGELLDQFARVYATGFTTEELQQIVAFYESPVGQKLSKASTDLAKGTKAVLQVFTANLGAEFFAKVRAELKTQGHDI